MYHVIFIDRMKYVRGNMYSPLKNENETNLNPVRRTIWNKFIAANSRTQKTPKDFNNLCYYFWFNIVSEQKQA